MFSFTINVSIFTGSIIVIIKLAVSNLAFIEQVQYAKYIMYLSLNDLF